MEVVEHGFAIGVQRPGHGGGTAALRCGQDAGDAAALGGYRVRIGLPARSGASHSQGHDQRRPHTAGYQGHSPGKALEAGDGLDAGLDGPGPIGHGGGPWDAHRPAVRHGQEDPAVIPAVLPLQTLQNTLVAQGLPVVVHLVKDQPQKGITPVETAQGGGEPPGPQVPVLQV